MVRLLMSMSVYIEEVRKESLDPTSSSFVQTVAWQQIYFEVPFYLFLIVPMSMLFSWKLAYRNLWEFITHEEQPSHRHSVCSAESLDHDENQLRRNSSRQSNKEPLLPVNLAKPDATFGLKRLFNVIVTTIVFALFINSFLVIFHYFESEGSEVTLRYQLGNILYFTVFFVLFGI